MSISTEPGWSPRLDHVGLAVRDTAAAAHLFIDVLGGRFTLGGDNSDTHNRVMQIALGGFKVELLQPLSSASRLQDFLDKRGEGFHHVTYVVDDLEEAVGRCEEASFPVAGTDLSNPIWSESYLTPRVTGGTLIQLASTTRDWTTRVDGIGLDDVLAGAVEFHDAWPQRRDSATTRRDGGA